MRLPITEAKPGTYLVSPVFDSSGRILAQSGLVLDTMTIERLRSRGVAWVDITEGDPAEAERKLSRVRAEKARVRFARSPDTPEMAQLWRVLLEVIDG